LDCIVGPFENLGDLLIEGDMGAIAFLNGAFLIGASLIGGNALTEGVGVDSFI